MAADFRELIEPYHRELLVHCYRMLGNLQDAEDVLQETLPVAWWGLDGFQERSSLRTWLYRIATNRCLNALRWVRAVAGCRAGPTNDAWGRPGPALRHTPALGV